LWKKFARAAKLAEQSGFKGVEIHASHGYLVDQFLSDKTNKRDDKYGGDAVRRTTLAVAIIHAIRQVVPPTFCTGILLGSVPPEDEHAYRARFEQLETLAAAGLDYVHLSGGTLEMPSMFLGPSVRRGYKATTAEVTRPYFVDFAARARSWLKEVPVIVTGGFRRREEVEAAIVSNAADMVGIARPAAVNSSLAKEVILATQVGDEEATWYSKRVDPSWNIKLMGVTALSVHTDNVSPLL
jgi:2,4-dienoyl-CoA reductase-like NADH-dependent reductase (Old Yellow Enzyme family)